MPEHTIRIEGSAAAVSYDCAADKTRAQVLLGGLIPQGAEVYDSLHLAPGVASGDPMRQRGWIGAKWRAASA